MQRQFLNCETESAMIWQISKYACYLEFRKRFQQIASFVYMNKWIVTRKGRWSDMTRLRHEPMSSLHPPVSFVYLFASKTLFFQCKIKYALTTGRPNRAPWMQNSGILQKQLREKLNMRHLTQSVSVLDYFYKQIVHHPFIFLLQFCLGQVSVGGTNCYSATLSTFLLLTIQMAGNMHIRKTTVYWKIVYKLLFYLPYLRPVSKWCF